MSAEPTIDPVLHGRYGWNEVGPHRRDLQARAQNNPVSEWCIRYLHGDDGRPIPEYHLDIYDLLEQRLPRVGVKAARSFAKSTLFKNYLCYLACKHAEAKAKGEEFHHKCVLVLSDAGPRARRLLMDVRDQLEFNPLIRETYGNMVGKKWTEDNIITKSGFEIRALGRGQQVRGWRATLILLDDLDNDEEVLSDDQLEKAFDWVDGPLINTLDEEGCQAFAIGTVIDEVCIINYICEKPGWVVRSFPALSEDGERPLWPSKWPKWRLEERKNEIGIRSFSAEFLLLPIPSANPIFERHWFKQYDPNSDEFQMILKRGTYNVVTCDPATSKQDGTDYTALVTASATFENPPRVFIRVGGVRCEYYTLGQTIGHIWDCYEKFYGHVAGLESNGYQAVIKPELEEWLEFRRHEMTIEELFADKDKERRALAVQPFVSRGLVYVSFTDPMIHRMVTQCVQYRRGKKNMKKDLFDAFVYAIMIIQDWYRRGRDDDEDGPSKQLPGGARPNPLTGVVT